MAKIKLRTAKELSKKYGYWKAHPKYPVQDWMEDVENKYTRLGYWDWVVSAIDAEAARHA